MGPCVCVRDAAARGCASRAEPGARRRVRSGRRGLGRTSGRGVHSGGALGSCAGPEARARWAGSPPLGARTDAPTSARRSGGPRRPGALAPGQASGRGGGRPCGCGSPIVRPARQWAARGGTCSPERPINRRRVQLPSRPSPRTGEPRRGRGPGKEPPARHSRARGRRARRAPSPRERPAPRTAVPSGGHCWPSCPVPRHPHTRLGSGARSGCLRTKFLSFGSPVVTVKLLFTGLGAWESTLTLRTRLPANRQPGVG